VYEEDQYDIMKALSKNFDHEDVEMWEELRQIVPKQDVLYMAKMCRIKMEDETILQELHDEFFKKYPMLKLLSYYEVAEKKNKETIAQYINGAVK